MKFFALLIVSTLAIVACTHAGPRLVAPGPALDAFSAMDTDHDGVISPVEFQRGMAGLAPADEAGRLFRHLDLDHDGALSPAEYFPEPKL